MNVTIRRAEAADLAMAAFMAAQLWPDTPAHEHAQTLQEVILSDEGAVFLAEDGGCTVGFAQCQLRHDYVEGTDSSPVGYLEGIRVDDAYRGNGIARALLAACEDWARSCGCTEFASDCELDNVQSLRFHLHTGFEEANRIICFTKKL